ncbi:MAG: hypothetical protein M3328_00070, partial [Chloroflexota bacterium]|nr:hypothetical protein [Chloroflexota bacterium]
DVATVSRWDGDYAPAEKRKPFATTGLFWSILVGFVVLSYGLPTLLLYLASSNVDVGGEISTIALVLFGVLQLGAIIGGVMSLNRSRPRAMGLLIGVLLVIVVLPFVAVVVLFGICLAALGGTNI